MADRWIRFDPGTDEGIAKSLSLLSLTAEEGVSSLPLYELTAEIVDKSTFVFYLTAGRPVAVRWSPDNDPKHDRCFEGIVVDIEDIDDDAVPAVRLEVRPWLWLLTQNVQCRIYQDASVLEIIEDLIRNDLTGNFAGNFRYDISGIRKGAYAERNYCVQYNESDFDFLSRILEDEGIYYYYGPDGILYFADDSTTSPARAAFVASDSQSKASDYPQPAWNTAAGPIRRWRRSQRYKTSNHEVCDVHVQTPTEAYVGAQGWTTQLLLNGTSIELPRIAKLVAREASAGFSKQIEFVDKSGAEDAQASSTDGADVRKLAERIATVRAEEKGCGAYRIEGNGEYPFFCPGVSFHPAENLDKGISGSFLCLEVRHQIATTSVRSNDASGARSYSNSFVCMPRNITYRPPRKTQKPTIVGTQTALVVGIAEDSAVCADVLGRIMVEFYWMKPSANKSPRLRIHDPEQCSAWVRWMQPWAGSAFGMQTIPRVGHEVVIAFQDGDPDQPIAIGSVSNNKNRPAFPPKEQPNVSGLKTNSIGRDVSSFNGLRFDDSPDKEVTQLRGQRELLVDAKENVALSAGNSLVALAARNLTIVGEQTNIVGLGGQNGEEKDHWNQELTAVFPDGWTPVVQAAEPAASTRFSAAFGYDVHMGGEFTLNAIGGRHDLCGPALGEIGDLADALGLAPTSMAKAAALAAAVDTLWRSIAQGLGSLEDNGGPGTTIVGGLSLQLYRGGKYEFVGADEWPLFGKAALVVKVGWMMYGAAATMIPGYLIEEDPSTAAETAQTCTSIARGIAFIVLNAERILAGLTAAKRLAASGVVAGGVVRQEAATGSFSFRHALNVARKLSHAASKIVGDLNEGNSFQEILGGQYVHAGKDIGLQAETGISFESPSILAKGDEISFHAGGSKLILGNSLSPVNLSSDLFTLKHSPVQGLELAVGPGSIKISPLGKISIKGLTIDLDSPKISLQAGPSSVAIDIDSVTVSGPMVNNEAKLGLNMKCPKQNHTPM